MCPAVRKFRWHDDAVLDLSDFVCAGPLEVGAGQPLLDNYKLVCPYPFMSMPSMALSSESI